MLTTVIVIEIKAKKLRKAESFGDQKRTPQGLPRDSPQECVIYNSLQFPFSPWGLPKESPRND